MAIEPYRRRIALPDAPGPARVADTRVADIGPAIAGLGETLQRTFEAQHRKEAADAGVASAGSVALRDEAGNLVLPEPEGGGLFYRAAFDEAVKQRYLNELQFAHQNWLNEEVRLRRSGELEDKPYDASDFEATALGRLQGVLETVDPSVRGQAEEILVRETLERTRGFGEEVSRTRRAGAIAGIEAQNRVLLNRIGKAADLGLSMDAVKDMQAALEANLDRLATAYQAHPAEISAMVMASDHEIADFENYIGSSRDLLSLAPVIGAASEEMLTQMEWALRLPYGGEGEALEAMGGEAAAGLTSGGGTWSLPVAGGVTTQDAQRFGASRDGGARTHNGLDIAAPAGTPVRPVRPGQVVSTGFDAKSGNFVVVRHADGATSSYSHLGSIAVKADAFVDGSSLLGTVGKTGNATGNVLHLVIKPDGKTAVDPATLLGKPASDGTSLTVNAVEAAGVTFERVRQWDPSVRSQALQMLTDRRQRLHEIRAEQEAQAREDARAAEEQRRHEELINSVEGAASAGVGGNWTAQQRGAIDRQFAETFDWRTVGTDEGRAFVMRFVRDKQAIPSQLVNWFDNSVRSPDWQTSFQLYEQVRHVTMPNGSKVGDLLTEKLDSRSRALFDEARRMREAGNSYQEIGVRLERLRSGDGFTQNEARAEFTKQLPPGERRSYAGERDKMLRDAYGFPANTALPPELVRRIDASFAANLDVADRRPVEALRRAVEQNKGLMSKSPVFFEGVGPSDLVRNYSIGDLARFFANERDQGGKPLVPLGRGLRVGRDIKLVPLEVDFGRIGRYQVRITDPKTRVLIDSYELDLGAELAESDPRTPAAVKRDPVAIAREQRRREAVVPKVVH